VTQVRHGAMLLKLIKSKYPQIRVVFIQGENESKEKQDALLRLNKKELDVVIATSVFGEGVDVPNLDVLINAKGNDSVIDTLQLIGRALRKTEHKNKAFFIDFVDNNNYTRRHSRNRFRVLSNERLFK